MVPPWLLLVLNAVVPITIVTIVTLIFVPGPTVPKNTPKMLIWKRKLWELHVGLLGLALSLCSAWFFTQGMKNMYGKPRPDLLARCEPDIENAEKYMVGGLSFGSTNGQLFSADICQQTDSAKMDDGFRSYPSGHSSSAAAGLIYTSLFLASKFSVIIPFVVTGSRTGDAGTLSAFPSRMRSEVDPYEPTRTRDMNSPFQDGKFAARQNAKIQSLRLQAAAPPLYLLTIVLMPFCVAIFIASSRWFDFRHHGFDILFGFLMGTVTAIYSFRYYHLPIQEGAGWAWGPRDEQRAFWSGVGRLGYAGDAGDLPPSRVPTHDLGESSDTAYRPPVTSGALNQRTGSQLRSDSHGSHGSHASRGSHHSPERHERQDLHDTRRQFQSVELERMDSSDRVPQEQRI